MPGVYNRGDNIKKNYIKKYSKKQKEVVEESSDKDINKKEDKKKKVKNDKDKLRMEENVKNGLQPRDDFKWLNEERNQLKNMCKEGKFYSDIAKVLQRSEQKIKYRAYDMQQKMVNDKDNIKSMKEIAEEFNLTEQEMAIFWKEQEEEVNKFKEEQKLKKINEETNQNIAQNDPENININVNNELQQVNSNQTDINEVQPINSDKKDDTKEVIQQNNNDQKTISENKTDIKIYKSLDICDEISEIEKLYKLFKIVKKLYKNKEEIDTVAEYMDSKISSCCKIFKEKLCDKKNINSENK